jgi:hypothetical protein
MFLPHRADAAAKKSAKQRIKEVRLSFPIDRLFFVAGPHRL